MYTREKLCKDQNQNHKSRKGDRINPPSFSSTLLDEIYRSIDGNAKISGDLKEKNLWRKSSYEEIASSRRVEKWIMEKEAKEKAAAKKRQQFVQELDNELIFFSSTSSSSDSSGALSSSDTEFFGPSRSKPKVSCFATRPKPVRTGSRCGSEEKEKEKEKDEKRLDDGEKGEDDLMKSKSRALKIYAKVKQPISPGGRLSTFINSLFSNGGSGKKRSSRNEEARGDASASRSCLSKYSPRSREKMRTGEQRTVRFEPLVDGDLRGPKSTVYDGHSASFARPPLPPTPPALSLHLHLHNQVQSLVAHNTSQITTTDHNTIFYNVDEDEDDDDNLSDSSSDLFELDHLELYGSNRYNQELPVYETTHFLTNRAIASGLIR